MPAINALLPIVAASNSQKQSTQSRADESRADAAKSAASVAAKGLEQDAAAEKRMQQKRFINAYEEGIQEQGREQDRRSQRVAALELAQRDDAAALAASGTELPAKGEPLPTALVASAPATSPIANNDQASAPQAPVAPVESAVPSGTDTLSFEQQQRAAAEAFHALVEAHNGKVDGKQLASQSPATQGIAAAASAQAQAVDAAALNDPARGDISAQASTAAPERAQQVFAGGEESSAAGQSQSAQSAATLALNEVQAGSDEPEQAQLVRAWRGIDAQEQRSATAASTQASRQDPIAASVPISFSGQIQQFAQSLRQAGAKPEASVSASAGERAPASTSLSSAEISPLRAETAAANAASTSGRGAAATNSFAQTMQASNFGQALGSAVGQNAWGESIAQRVSLMAGLKVSSAQIQLDPPELGAMTVKVSVNGDQASVSFHSPHAVVRDALELSFPRLQEMMGQQGMQLVDAQVSDNSSAGQGSGQPASGRAGQSQADAGDEASASAAPQIVQVATGLIDFYA